MNLETAIGNGYIVASDSWLGVVVVWTGATQFDMYRQRDMDTWMHVDSMFSFVPNAYQAKRQAQKWIDYQYEQLEKSVA